MPERWGRSNQGCGGANLTSAKVHSCLRWEAGPFFSSAPGRSTCADRARRLKVIFTRERHRWFPLYAVGLAPAGSAPQTPVETSARHDLVARRKLGEECHRSAAAGQAGLCWRVGSGGDEGVKLASRNF